MKLRSRRFLSAALALMVLGATGSLMVHPSKASSAPSGATLPDFTQGVPYAEQRVSPWGLWVQTGGLGDDDVISIRFDFGSGPGTGTHAVTFQDLLPSALKNDVAFGILPVASTLPPLPGVTTATPNCTGLIRGTSEIDADISADPYAQTVSLKVHPGLNQSIAAGTTVGICFQSGEVGFPVAPASSGYSITYTEPGGHTNVGYSVSAQAAGQSHSVNVLDVDGTDVTNTGLGGSGRLLAYGTTYHLALSGTPAQYYYISATAYVAEPLLGGTPDVKLNIYSTSANALCQLNTANTLCGDNVTGQGTGTLQITSTAPVGEQPVVYLVMSGRPENTNGNTEKSTSQFAVTVGPSGAAPPSATATPAPTPTLTGPHPGSNDFCPQAPRAVAGLGSGEVYSAIVDAILPALSGQCPSDANQISYSQVPDDSAAAQVLATQPEYTFAGMDRPLSAQEIGGDPTQGGNPIGTELNGGGVDQFPINEQPLVITYNLPDTQQCKVTDTPDSPGNKLPIHPQLMLSSLALSGIFSGAVTKWNDTLITGNNSELANCNMPLLVAHDLGTASSVLKDYLSKRNPHWKAYTQASLANQWPPTAPVSCTANGSVAMALCVEGQPGSIGYGFYHDIHNAGLPIALVDNASLQFPNVSPPEGCQTAAATDPVVSAAKNNTDWSNISITDWAQGYPICAFNFVVSFQNPCTHYVPDMAFMGLVFAAISPYGQALLTEHGYGPLPPSLQTLNDNTLAQMNLQSAC